jgi:DNA-binding HxlR family transcriptional regulator
MGRIQASRKSADPAAARSVKGDSIVTRIVHPVVPPKVEYRLTPGGEVVYPVLDELLYWAQR